VRTRPIPGLAASGEGVGAATPAIAIAGFAFLPFRSEVAVGATVTWTNRDGAAHTVTAEDGGFDSGRLDRGQEFARRFEAPGSFFYYCLYHKDMTGVIAVA
jgi:plastocyanin